MMIPSKRGTRTLDAVHMGFPEPACLPLDALVGHLSCSSSSFSSRLCSAGLVAWDASSQLV